MTLSLAFLAPAIVNAALDGRLPRDVGISRLSDLPASWREQFGQIGLVERSSSFPAAADS
jgi:site-specific DNA recombinase